MDIKNIKVGSMLFFKASEEASAKDKYGEVIYINDSYVLVQFPTYKESFLKVDLKMRDDVTIL